MSNRKWMITKNMPRQEWLQWRKTGIGSSDAGPVSGRSVWKTPFMVWADKLNKPEAQPEQYTEQMEAGNYLEDRIAEKFAAQMGLKVRKDNKMRIHNDLHYVVADLDYTIPAGQLTREQSLQYFGAEVHGTGILECKFALDYTKHHWDEGMPTYYYCQVQHQCEVAEMEWGFLTVCFGGYEHRHIPFLRNRPYMNELLAIYYDFWIHHIDTDTAPDPINEGDIKALYPEVDPDRRIVADANALELLADAKYFKELAAGTLRQKETAYTNVKGYMKTAELLVDEEDKLLATFGGRDGSRRLNLK